MAVQRSRSSSLLNAFSVDAGRGGTRRASVAALKRQIRTLRSAGVMPRHNDSVSTVAWRMQRRHAHSMKVVGALVAMVVLTACTAQGDTKGAGSSVPPVPARLEAGCPPADTQLRFPAGELPANAVAVRLCPGAPYLGRDGTPQGPEAQAPIDELTSGTDRLVSLVNDLPSVDLPIDCPFGGGGDVVYWFRYADGDARAVSYSTGGCRLLTVGNDLALDHGERLTAAFAEALLAQRARTSPPDHAAMKVQPKCGDSFAKPLSPLPHVPLDMTQATLCRSAGPNRVSSAPIPRPLLRRLNDSPLTKVRRTAPAPADCRVPPARTIEGITRWGDRVTYLVPGECLYAYTGDDSNDGGQGSTTFRIDTDVMAELTSLRLRTAPR